MHVPAHPLSAFQPGTRRQPALWGLNREAACNWLALGLLLGAWNAVDDAAALRRRPEPLRGYAAVSVRAIQRNQTVLGRRDGHNSVNVL